jgi:hypothetical protein
MSLQWPILRVFAVPNPPRSGKILLKTRLPILMSGKDIAGPEAISWLLCNSGLA